MSRLAHATFAAQGLEAERRSLDATVRHEAAQRARNRIRIHIHKEEFDGHPHPACGRGGTAVMPVIFEATDPALRCKLCERDWFPGGQPDWHLKAAQAKVKKTEGIDE